MKPQASSLKPQASSLKPQASSLKPQGELASRIKQKDQANRSINPPFDKCRMALEITNICNHKCVFCASSNLTRKRQYIDDDLCRRIIREGYELGVREITFHMLGEPFLNKNLANYIRAAKEIGYTYVYETTNGATVTPEKIDAVFSAGLDSIKFSINAATRESYLSIHGSDDFEKVKSNIIYCNEYRKRSNKKFSIFISYVATNQTLDEARRFKDEFADYADSIAFYKATMRSGANMEVTDKIGDGSNNEDRDCSQPFNAICVSCEGILSPCCIDPHLDLAMADLHNCSLKDAWRSEKMAKFRRMHVENKLEGTICEKCLKYGSNWLTVLDL